MTYRCTQKMLISIIFWMPATDTSNTFHWMPCLEEGSVTLPIKKRVGATCQTEVLSNHLLKALQLLFVCFFFSTEKWHLWQISSRVRGFLLPKFPVFFWPLWYASFWHVVTRRPRLGTTASKLLFFRWLQQENKAAVRTSGLVWKITSRVSFQCCVLETGTKSRRQKSNQSCVKELCCLTSHFSFSCL